MKLENSSILVVHLKQFFLTLICLVTLKSQTNKHGACRCPLVAASKPKIPSISLLCRPYSADDAYLKSVTALDNFLATALDNCTETEYSPFTQAIASQLLLSHRMMITPPVPSASRILKSIHQLDQICLTISPPSRSSIFVS